MQRGEIAFGKYRLHQPLGSGGMAEVWSATNSFTERQVAIKLIHPQLAQAPEAAARFLKEAKVSARVNHPNIVDVLDVGQTEEGRLFLVMELLTGCSLETALRGQTPPLTLHELAFVMLEVAAALSAAHKRGILHRDLKPTNIYLHEGKDRLVPKVLDFGVSKFLGEDTNHALTMAGTVLGSPFYMSPEQARGDSNLDGRTDIFAFGTILFEALCGYRPFEGKNFNALIVKVATTQPKSIDACAPHMPEALRRVVRACMETDAERRVATFDEVIMMLEEAMPVLEASSTRVPTPLAASDPAPESSMPVLRPSAPPSGSLSRSGSYAPNTSVTLPPPSNPKRSAGWLIASGSALLVGTAIAAVLLVHPNARATAARAPAAAIVEAARGPHVFVGSAQPHAKGSEPPTVSVDALPRAMAKGRLTIASSPRSCTVSVDGKDFGATPVTAIELAVGPHEVVCRPAQGNARTATITIDEGAMSKYRFEE